MTDNVTYMMEIAFKSDGVTYTEILAENAINSFNNDAIAIEHAEAKIKPYEETRSLVRVYKLVVEEQDIKLY